MIMRITDDDDGFFREGIEPSSDVYDQFRPSITNWRFVTVDPALRLLRAEPAHAVLPAPRMPQKPARGAVAEQFNESLYFG